MNTSPPLKPYRYLIVDDDQFTCNCLVKLLTKLAASDVCALSDSRDAIRWFDTADANRKLPDIIICDLNMPELDGIEYTSHLSNKGFTGGIIFMSATAVELLDSVGRLAAAKKLNVLGTLVKPISPEHIIELVSQWQNGERRAPHGG